MSLTLREDKTILIEEYSLADFVLAIQKTVQAGYEISLENTNYPQGFSGHFTVGMVDAKGNTQTSTETPLEAPTSPSKEQVTTTVPEATDKPVTAAKTTSRTAKKTT